MASSRDRFALAACVGAGFATLLDQSVVTYTIPSLGPQLGATTGGVQWFLAVYSLTFGVGLVPGGRLGDAYGRRGMFVGGLVLFLLGAALSVFAPGIGWAIAGRAVQGFGAGVVSAQVLGVIQDVFAGRARIRALAAYGMAASASAIVGPLAAGATIALLPEPVAWRVVLAINVPFILAVAVLAARFVPRGGGVAGRPSLDLVGIAVTAAVVLLATAPVIDPGLGALRTGLAIGGVAVGSAALVWWERRYARRGGRPLFSPTLLRSRGFTGGSVVALLWFGAAVAQSAIVTVFLLQSLGMPAVVVALVLAPSAAARIATSALSSRLHDALGRWTLVTFLGAQTACSIALIALTGVTDGVALLVWIIVLEALIGAASGAFEPPMRALTLAHARPGEYGLAASFLQLAQRLSATFCVALVTGVAFGGIGVAVSRDGLQAGLAVCGALLIGASAVAVAMVPGRVPRFSLRARPAVADESCADPGPRGGLQE
ncbi:MFS transporter [Leifsonia sp. NPDC058194]|uniref:MFS transporter n=1 Tax=Leifsonia sp. NPDC058194 TaxID=3346374 RepID=UPI0036DCB7ED